MCTLPAHHTGLICQMHVCMFLGKGVRIICDHAKTYFPLFSLVILLERDELRFTSHHAAFPFVWSDQLHFTLIKFTRVSKFRLWTDFSIYICWSSVKYVLTLYILPAAANSFTIPNVSNDPHNTLLTFPCTKIHQPHSHVVCNKLGWGFRKRREGD